VFFWDILRNEIVKALNIDNEEKMEHFKWSHDSKYVGRIKQERLMVYESPKMIMIPDAQGKRQPIKLNVKDYYWFPKRNNIVTVTEIKNNNGKLRESVLQFFEVNNYI
jgi:uncharacterized protein with WD repeat